MMSQTTDGESTIQNEYRHRISINQDLVIPKELLPKVGFVSKYAQAVTNWYYDSHHQKVLIANDLLAGDHISEIETYSLQGVMNSEVEAGSNTSARVSVPQNIPDEARGRLYNEDEPVDVVLKPEDPRNSPPFIAVYPEYLYDTGDLPTVEIEEKETGSRKIHDNVS